MIDVTRHGFKVLERAPSIENVPYTIDDLGDDNYYDRFVAVFNKAGIKIVTPYLNRVTRSITLDTTVNNFEVKIVLSLSQTIMREQVLRQVAKSAKQFIIDSQEACPVRLNLSYAFVKFADDKLNGFTLAYSNSSIRINIWTTFNTQSATVQVENKRERRIDLIFSTKTLTPKGIMDEVESKMSKHGTLSSFLLR